MHIHWETMAATLIFFALSSTVHANVGGECVAQDVQQGLREPRIDDAEQLLENGHAEIGIGELLSIVEAAKQSNDLKKLAVAQGALGSAYGRKINLDGIAEDWSRLALDQINSSIKLADNLGLYRVKADSLINKGNVLFSEGRVGDAENSYAAAVDSADRVDAWDLVELASTNHARASMRAGDRALAEHLLAMVANSGADESRLHGPALPLVTAGRLAANAAAGFGHDYPDFYGIAERALDEAIARARATGDLRTESLAFGYLGELHGVVELGVRDDAERLLNEALFLAQSIQAADLVYRWDRDLGELFKWQGRNIPAITALRRAVETLETVRSGIPIEYHGGRSSFLEAYGGLYRELADLLLVEGRQGRLPEMMTEAQTVLETLKIGEFKDYFPRRCFAEAVARAKEIRQIRGKYVVIYPVILPDRLEVLALFPDGPRESFDDGIKSTDMAELAKQFRSALENRSAVGNEDRYEGAGRRLYELLLDKFEPELKRQDIKTIVWIPDGDLRLIPIAALKIPQAGGRSDFLIDHYAVATAQGLALVQDAGQRVDRTGQIVLAGLSVKSVAVPDFNLPALPGVQAEINTIHAQNPGPAPMIDRSFTAKNLLSALSHPQGSVIHIATHARFDHDPKMTFLETSDEHYYLDDLEMALERGRSEHPALDLIVLSACDTGQSDDRAAMGLAGVALTAGARSAIATLWEIYDNPSAALFVKFYKMLGRHGVGKAEALREAIGSLKSDPNFADPYYWAPFLLIGDWR